MNIRKIVKKLIPTSLFRKIEPFGHLVESFIANVHYGFPSRKMHVIGVTGTNGKTTTTFLIHRMLVESGYKSGFLSTVAYGVGNDIHNQMEHMTTEKAGVLQKRLRDFKRAGVEWVVLESSSHALAQHRSWGAPFEIAVMTNVTYEHLDYHKTFENYLEAKRQLFVMASKHGRKLSVVNADDPNADKFIKTTSNSITYGIKSGDLQAKDIKLASDYSTFKAVIGKDSYDIRINIPGDFNVSNALAVVAVGREIGLTKQQIEKGIAALPGVEGRMTIVDMGQKFKVVVDYAGTPDAFERFFHTVRPTVKGKLICVFGSPAHRDKAKRPVQGEIAGKNCEVVIATEEDDRDEPSDQILNQIGDGAKKAGKKLNKDLFLIQYRDEAIGFALTLANSADDVVAILGKGHEKTIERADGIHPWSDIEVTKTALKEMLKESKQAKSK